MKVPIEAVKEERYGDIKFMIGGGEMDNEIRDYVGAKAYDKDAIAAVNLCNQWIIGEAQNPQTICDSIKNL